VESVPLFTLGYAGLDGPDDIRRLTSGTPVTTVVDIRLKRWSRIPAFSMATAQTVEAAGFRYVYLPDLGNLAYRTGGMQIRRLDGIVDVLNLMDTGETVALMCACKRPETCHRTFVAHEAVRRRPWLVVDHLRGGR
jgi:uncharacterized protein (DUF488 family)